MKLIETKELSGVKRRRVLAYNRLVLQLQAGKKTKKGKPVKEMALSDKDKDRIEKELKILKSKI